MTTEGQKEGRKEAGGTEEGGGGLAQGQGRAVSLLQPLSLTVASPGPHRGIPRVDLLCLLKDVPSGFLRGMETAPRFRFRLA